MTNKEFILKLIKYCCFGLLLFVVFVLSFGCGFYYRDSGHIMQVNAQSVKLNTADTVVNGVYTSGQFAVPISFFNSTTFPNNFSYTDYYMVNFSLSSNSLSVFGFRQLVSSGSFNSIYGFDYTDTNFTTGNWFITSIRSVVVNNSNGSQSNDLYTFISYYIDNGFNYNVYKVSFMSENGFRGNNSYKTEKIVLTDSNDLTFTLCFPARFESVYVNTDLFYFGNSDYLLSNSLSDNDSYQSGYQDGYNIGNSVGQSTGYDNGYNVGFGNGDLVGYQRGIEDSNQYTFLNLIGAVIDAPITAFVNLLDFNVFGFNMLNLCCSLLTLSLIILVVKFVLFRS